jgi:protein-disulfide isomerase
MKRYLPFIIIIAVALVALGSATALYRAKKRTQLSIPAQIVIAGREAVHSLGDPKAAVTLEEFGDFQCPPCATIAPSINQLEQDYKSDLRVIFSHYPLSTHQHAFEAALASEAADLQGRFWEMHDLLYREQSSWSKAPDVRPLFNSYAGILGLNIDRFKKDMESEPVKARVTSDQTRAASLGVSTTPSIFINNRAVPPSSLNPADLRNAIKAAINSKVPAG